MTVRVDRAPAQIWRCSGTGPSPYGAAGQLRKVLRGGNGSCPWSRPARSRSLGIHKKDVSTAIGSDWETFPVKKTGAVQSMSQTITFGPSGVHAGHTLSCSASTIETELAISSDIFAPARSCKSTPLKRATERQSAARRTKRRIHSI